MGSFIDLQEFKSYEKSIITWLKNKNGKDKQESLLRLFAGIGIIEKLESYYICNGNFNQKTITKMNTKKDIFYNQEGDPIKLKDKGNSSEGKSFVKRMKNIYYM